MWLLPRLPVPILPAQAPFVSHVAAGAPVAGRRVEAVGWIPLFELLYLAIAALLVARIAIARLIIERLWRCATPLRCATILEQAAAISARLGIRRNIAIRIADREVVPMTWGSINPRIVLPQEALGWGEERWHSVLLHELGHVSRHDSLSRLAVETICALYWPHPGMRLAARRLRLAQEQACDDLALTHGAPALGYARDLLDCASRDHRPRAARRWRARTSSGGFVPSSARKAAPVRARHSSAYCRPGSRNTSIISGNVTCPRSICCPEW